MFLYWRSHAPIGGYPACIRHPLTGATPTDTAPLPPSLQLALQPSQGSGSRGLTNPHCAFGTECLEWDSSSRAFPPSAYLCSVSIGDLGPPMGWVRCARPPYIHYPLSSPGLPPPLLPAVGPVGLPQLTCLPFLSLTSCCPCIHRTLLYTSPGLSSRIRSAVVNSVW